MANINQHRPRQPDRHQFIQERHIIIDANGTSVAPLRKTLHILDVPPFVKFREIFYLLRYNTNKTP